ncbi:MAG TPA: DUF4278 domain-containing protein [Oscillatoriales cyanobacterium M59_W2019_021]|nr:DUF4278 domain-containing protein [Oscillatoriales cyanobacterium M4454_W2019_049]HIK50043.1 DUF4278 domain-containing protein [Oscillatoriales cyanobacterium M59_W2019_021]
MKLTYRGVTYEYNPCPQDMTEGKILGRYRGRDWSLRYPRHMSVPQPIAQFQYRGVPYRTTATGDIQAVNTQTPALGNVKQPTLSEVAKVHHAHLIQRLQRRLEVAKAQGDAQLVSLLEEESRQLA